MVEEDVVLRLLNLQPLISGDGRYMVPAAINRSWRQSSNGILALHSQPMRKDAAKKSKTLLRSALIEL